MNGVLCVLGDIVEDIVVWQDSALAFGTDTPAKIHRARGGSAANVAALAAGLVPTRFIGRVGEDAVGDALAASLTAGGVDVRLQRGGRTGTIVILIAPDGERTMLPDRGASAEIDTITPSWLDGVGAFHLTAYTLSTETARRHAIDAMRQAAAQGALTSLDVSSVAVIKALGADHLHELIDQIAPAIIFSNAAEATALSLPSQRHRSRIVVIKRGASPTTIHYHDQTLSIPVKKVEDIRDLTAAGDAFAAGFLASCLRTTAERSSLGETNLLAAAVDAHTNAARVLRLPGSGNLLTTPPR